MKYYLYHQNNTGGSWVIDDEVAEYVIIEAYDEKDANEIAKSKGIYFDGVDKEIDCECCGDRWYYPSVFNTLEDAKERTENQFSRDKKCRVHLKNKMPVYELDKDLFEIE